MITGNIKGEHFLQPAERLCLKYFEMKSFFFVLALCIIATAIAMPAEVIHQEVQEEVQQVDQERDSSSSEEELAETLGSVKGLKLPSRSSLGQIKKKSQNILAPSVTY